MIGPDAIAYTLHRTHFGGKNIVAEMAVARNEDPAVERWFALQVRSRHEKSVSHSLVRQRSGVFLPIVP